MFLIRTSYDTCTKKSKAYLYYHTDVHVQDIEVKRILHRKLSGTGILMEIFK